MREKPLWGRHPHGFGYIESVAELCEMYEACPIVTEGFGLDRMHEYDRFFGNNVRREERRQ